VIGLRRYGLYDLTRGLTTLAAAAFAGLLLWTATQVGQQTTGRYWAELALVAVAGLALSLAHALAGWTKGLRFRLSPGTFLLGFLPVLVCAVWILMTAQPGNGWQEGRIVGWSGSMGILGVVHSLALWNGVLAFALGLVLGLTVDSVPAAEAASEAAPADRWVADEPLAREREAAHNAEPQTVTVGPAQRDAATDTTVSRS